MHTFFDVLSSFGNDILFCLSMGETNHPLVDKSLPAKPAFSSIYTRICIYNPVRLKYRANRHSSHLGSETIDQFKEKNSDAHIVATVIKAAIEGNIGVLNYIIEQKGASVLNEGDRRGRTPLHNVISCSLTPWHMASFLIENGANIHLLDDAGYTPLEMSLNPEMPLLHEREKIACLLISKGATIFKWGWWRSSKADNLLAEKIVKDITFEKCKLLEHLNERELLNRDITNLIARFFYDAFLKDREID